MSTLQISASASTASRPERLGRKVEKPRNPRAPYVLDPQTLPDHIDVLYRAACALCGSRTDADDLVQTTFARVLARPRIIRRGNERGYLLRSLRNTYASSYRTQMRRPALVELHEDDAHFAEAPITSRGIIEAIASAPPNYRDAVIAVDVVGLSYREAARSLHTREETVATRLHRGRQHVARELVDRGVEQSSSHRSEGHENH